MLQQVPVLALTVTASGTITARRSVTLAGAQAAAQGAKVLGIADNDAANADLIPVITIGTAIVEAGAAITVGASLICDSQGRAIPSTGPLAIKSGATAVLSTAANGSTVLQGADPPEWVFGYALEAASGAGVKIEVLLSH